MSELLATERRCIVFPVRYKLNLYIYIYIEESRPPLWSSGQSSWLQIQRSGFDTPRFQIFWEVVGLERSPLSLVSTTEELLGRKCSGSGREYGLRDPSRWPRGILYPQKLALASPTSGSRSVGTVRSRTKATVFSLVFYFLSYATGIRSVMRLTLSWQVDMLP
jgi:hypothetical protein